MSHYCPKCLPMRKHLSRLRLLLDPTYGLLQECPWQPAICMTCGSQWEWKHDQGWVIRPAAYDPTTDRLVD